MISVIYENTSCTISTGSENTSCNMFTKSDTRSPTNCGTPFVEGVQEIQRI